MYPNCSYQAEDRGGIVPVLVTLVGGGLCRLPIAAYVTSANNYVLV